MWKSIFMFSLLSLSLATMLRPPKDVQREAVIESIRKLVKEGELKGKAFDDLAYYVDTIGPRMWGSPAMAEAVDALYEQANGLKFDKVWKESLGEIETWRRGKESLILYDPRPVPQKLNLIGLGRGIGGKLEKKEVIVVRSWQELDDVKDQVAGKIVCYNQAWTTYSESVQYRSLGAVNAEKYGAVGVLLRSVASTSMDSPHTGTTSRANKIPAAAISIEDAEMFQRMQDRKQKIIVSLELESEYYKSTSHNVIAEIQGSKYPEQIVLMGGHWDSWDTGSQTGANDDGGGVIVCLEALRALRLLNIKPKRTIRFIAWSGEEMGLPGNGAEFYANNHKSEKHVLAFESDLGTTHPYGFGFDGNVRATQIVTQLAQQYLTGIGAEKIIPGEGESVDSGYLYRLGIPVMRNLVADNASHDFYFTYHHSAGDSMYMMDTTDLDDNVVAIASMMYLIAENEEALPAN